MKYQFLCTVFYRSFIRFFICFQDNCPRIIAPLDDRPTDNCPQENYLLPTRTIASEHNGPLDTYPQRKLHHMKIPSENNSTKFPRASTANELSRAMDGLQLGQFICCKTKLKKKIFFLKNMFFTKYTLFAEKMFLYGKKKFYIENFFY